MIDSEVVGLRAAIDAERDKVGRLEKALYEKQMFLESEQSRLSLANFKVSLLKRLCRFQFLTLGFYGTPYNYTTNVVCGIKQDQGEQAREAQKIATDLGFTGDEIRLWSGPNTDDVGNG